MMHSKYESFPGISLAVSNSLKVFFWATVTKVNSDVLPSDGLDRGHRRPDLWFP
jgi:hypothetical protein